MGQKRATPPPSAPSKCSIFRVDQDIKILDENSDESECSPPVPALQNNKPPRKTYSKRNPTASPGISLIPKPEYLTFDTLNCTLNGKDSSLKHNSEIICHQPSRKIQKKDIPKKRKTAFKSSKDVKYKRKAAFSENEIPSYSDTEVIVDNPSGLKLKPMNNVIKKLDGGIQNCLNNRKKMKLDYNDLVKKNEGEPASPHVSTSCFMAGNELVVKEADPAPHSPTNMNMFPNGQGVSSSTNVSHYDNHNMSKHSEMPSKSSENKVLHLPELKRQLTEKLEKSRELPNLQKNLNEIPGTQESSFKKLRQNPYYLRHSERNTTRVARTAKTLGQRALKTSKKTAILKRASVVKTSLKKCKLSKLSPNKKLSNLDKIKTANKVSKIHTKPPSKPSCNKLPSKNTISKIDIKPDLEETSKPISIMENFKPKHAKKQILNSNSKPKVISSPKISSKKAKNVKSKQAVPNKKAQVSMKTEDCEASSSGSQSFVYNTSVYDHNRQIADLETLEAPIQQKNINGNSYEFIRKYKKDNRAYTAGRQGSNCQVQVQPLKHKRAKPKVVEKKDSDSIATMLQELCDSCEAPSFLKTKKPEEEVLRSSARQSEIASRYKEIVVKKFPKYMQFILVPNIAKKNCLSIKAIKELKAAFLLAKKDQNCRAVLINSSGSYFCNGIDMAELIGSNKKKACEEMASVIKDLVMVLGQFPKPVVAAVNGSALGFGVSLLTYCDIVLASDKATFCIPSNILGYIPEGGVTMTLPQVVGPVYASEMLLQGIRITADQAFKKGLVSELVWPTYLMNAAIPRMEALTSQSLQVMMATKLSLRVNYWDKLKNRLELEHRLLSSKLLSAECQLNMKNLLANGAPFVD